METIIMDKLFGELLDKLKNVKDNKQLMGFLAAILALTLLAIIFFAKTQGGNYSLSTILLSFVLVGIFTFLIVFIFIGDNYFEYLKSRDWNRETTTFLRSQDQTKTPAFIASSNKRLNEGKALAYKHCLKEIDNVKNAGLSLNELKNIINGAINSIEE